MRDTQVLRVDIVTLLPGIVAGLLSEGLVRRAQDAGIVDVKTVQPRDFTNDQRRTVDDAPFGGGAGMVLKADPIVRAVESLPHAAGSCTVLLSASGGPLTQGTLQEFAKAPHLVLICGRYEGVDDRVRRLLDATEVSLGDFVLAGGEIAAMAIVEGVTRLLPGAVGDPVSLAEESFTGHGGLLEYPQYTRPPEYRGLRVPPVLLSGDHAKVARWRRWMALRKTARIRPDLFSRFTPGDDDRRLLEGFEFEEE